jgi:hypothetical protein
MISEEIKQQALDAWNASTRMSMLREGDPWRPIAEAIAAAQAKPFERLLKAASLVVQLKFDHFRKGNGRMSTIEGDDGEKCWIVPFDPMTMLEGAVEDLQNTKQS